MTIEPEDPRDIRLRSYVLEQAAEFHRLHYDLDALTVEDDVLVTAAKFLAFIEGPAQS